MMKKDGHNMYSDYENGSKVRLIRKDCVLYISVDDIITWLKENRPEAELIESDWLIKAFVRLKNSKR